MVSLIKELYAKDQRDLEVILENEKDILFTRGVAKREHVGATTSATNGIINQLLLSQ